MYPSAAKYYLKDDYLVLLVRKGASYSPGATLVSLRPNLQDTLYSALVTPSLSFILVVVCQFMAFQSDGKVSVFLLISTQRPSTGIIMRETIVIIIFI